jgi:hypothetical protein
MKNKNNVIITISLIGLMFTIFIGLSFAFFTSNLEGTESESTIITSSGTLSISYAEGDGNISIDNVYPREEAWLTKTFTLTGNNTTNLNMNYSVSLSIEENGFSSGDLTYSLTSEEAELGTVIEDKTDKSIGGVGNQTIGYGQFVKGTNITHTYTLSIYFKDNGKNQNASQGAVFSGKIVANEAGTGDIPILPPDGWENASSGTLLAGIKSNYSTPTNTLTTPGQQTSLGTVEDSTTYTMSVSSTYQDYYWTYGTGIEQNVDGTFNLTGLRTLKYSDDYSELVGKYIVSSSGASYNSSSSDKTKTYTNLTNIVQVQSATDSSLTYKMANSLTTTEAVLSSTEDDYGMSYYFRGAVENNYVVFASMCWRIVRITGDGSIKLTLYNYNNDKENTENPCSATDTSLAFARYSRTTYTSKFNTSRYNAYVGFMYGTAYSDTYDAEHENLYDSTILTNLKTWYDANFNETEQSLLADTIWCNDKRLSSGGGYGLNSSKYAAYGRLYEVATASPSLKCGDTKEDNKISKFTASDTKYGNGMLKAEQSDGTTKYYKIGLLTIDEVAYAGRINGSGNSTYYLYRNASSDSWWTLSPYDYSISQYDKTTRVWYVSLSGGIGSTDNSLAIRPAVSLVSNVKISSGDGTSTNPFVIDES